MSRRTTVSEELLVSPYWTRNMPAAVRVVAATGMCSQLTHRSHLRADQHTNTALPWWPSTKPWARSVSMALLTGWAETSYCR
jgi:hypothetical protein